MSDFKLVFGNGDYDQYYRHSFQRERLLRTRDAVELIVGIGLYYRDTVAGAVQAVSAALSGEHDVLPTTLQTFFVVSDDLLVDVNLVDAKSPFQVENRRLSATLYGRRDAIEAFYAKVEQHLQNDDVNIWWWFMKQNGLDSIRFALNDAREFKNEHYPFIEDASDYIGRFLASKESVLILLGEPGTGKTSFIRHMLKRAGGDCYVAYDEEVMANDQLYINFMSDESARFLVLEDSDLLLVERVKDNNRTMSKLLNAADGLVLPDKKKLIFTANIDDADKIDEALTRPGRCFDVLRFRALTPSEASAIVPATTLVEQSEYTLAEIFNKRS